MAPSNTKRTPERVRSLSPWRVRRALGGTRTPSLLIRRSGQVVQDGPSPVVGWAGIPELSTCVGCCSAAWLQSWLQSRRNGGHARGFRGLTRRLCPAAGICPVTARTVEGMAPYPGQARCLALGFWPECFRRLDVKGGRRKFPEETRSALDIEGKHVTIQGPSLDLIPAIPIAPSAGCRDLLIRRFLCGRPAPHAATS